MRPRPLPTSWLPPPPRRRRAWRSPRRSPSAGSPANDPPRRRCAFPRPMPAHGGLVALHVVRDDTHAHARGAHHEPLGEGDDRDGRVDEGLTRLARSELRAHRLERAAREEGVGGHAQREAVGVDPGAAEHGEVVRHLAPVRRLVAHDTRLVGLLRHPCVPSQVVTAGSTVVPNLSSSPLLASATTACARPTAPPPEEFDSLVSMIVDTIRPGTGASGTRFVERTTLVA